MFTKINVKPQGFYIHFVESAVESAHFLCHHQNELKVFLLLVTKSNGATTDAHVVPFDFVASR